MKRATVRIALYARVSTKDRGQDYQNQLRELRAFVKRKHTEGWRLTAEFVDEMSGSRADRPAFKRMFEAASRKEFDLVAFWSLDRFSREGVLETLQHLQKLTSHGVDWFSLREEYLRSIGIFRDAVLAILAAIAKQERVRISERVCAGLARARAKGKRLGRPPLVVNRARLKDMREQGATYQTIADKLKLSSRMSAYRLWKQIQTSAR